MNIKDNIVNYLYDREYLVALYENFVYIFNYKYLDSFDEKRIVVEVQKRTITIEGEHLLIVKMTKEELLIRGKISNIGVRYKDE